MPRAAAESTMGNAVTKPPPLSPAAAANALLLRQCDEAAPSITGEARAPLEAGSKEIETRQGRADAGATSLPVLLLREAGAARGASARASDGEWRPLKLLPLQGRNETGSLGAGDARAGETLAEI